MSILSNVNKGKQVRPRRVVEYGPHGVGKSSWAAMWPRPLFLAIEDGVGDLDVHSLPVKSLADFRTAVMELSGAGKHDYQTIVIDSIDWLEQFIWRDIAAAHGKDTVSEIPYGAGYKEAADKMAKILDVLTAIRDRGCHVLVIAHAEIKRFESPEGDSYDRYQPKLHASCSALLQEWADEVLFATYDVRTVAKDEGFGRKRTVGMSDGRRVLRTTERPSHLAKNRLGLPDEIPMELGKFYFGQYLNCGNKR